MTPLETYEHEGVTVRIYPDTDATSPREWDNATIMVTQADRYLSPDEPQFDNEREAFQRGDYELLERYLRTACGVVAFGQWQSQRDCWGYAYVTKERADELGVTNPDEALKAETQEYADWAQGICYGFIVDEEGPDEDSCWGYIGDDGYVKEAANEAAEYAAQCKAERQRKRGRALHHGTLVTGTGRGGR